MSAYFHRMRAFWLAACYCALNVGALGQTPTATEPAPKKQATPAQVPQKRSAPAEAPIKRSVLPPTTDAAQPPPVIAPVAPAPAADPHAHDGHSHAGHSKDDCGKGQPGGTAPGAHIVIPPGTAPKAVFEKDTMEAEPVWKGQTMTCTYTVRNEGDADLFIRPKAT